MTRLNVPSHIDMEAFIDVQGQERLWEDALWRTRIPLPETLGRRVKGKSEGRVRRTGSPGCAK